MKIQKLNPKGQGIHNPDTGRKYRFWNALTGEIVEEFDILRKTRGAFDCFATKISNKSVNRVESKELDHFLSCSPWQIFDFDFENNLKLKSGIEIFRSAGLETDDLNIEIISDGKQYGYRNKMEFSFYVENFDSVGDISLAFHKRSSKFGMIKITGCQLGSPEINHAAKKIIDWINNERLHKKDLKTLVVRSNGSGEALASLFVKKEMETNTLPSLDGKFTGFQLIFSDPKRSFSVQSKTLKKIGDDFLESETLKTKLKFGVNSFFQINIPVFELALKEIEKFAEKDSEVLDFYSGVGAIGLSLAKKAKSVKLVESSEEATEFAKINMDKNNVKNAEVFCSPSENLTELIESDQTLIFDPPRPGLHKNVIKRVLEKLPPKIIYLSCNPHTQADDVKKLSEKYKITYLKFFNFFPRTPHFESLCVLEKKA